VWVSNTARVALAFWSAVLLRRFRLGRFTASNTEVAMEEYFAPEKKSAAAADALQNA